MVSASRLGHWQFVRHTRKVLLKIGKHRTTSLLLDYSHWLWTFPKTICSLSPFTSIQRLLKVSPTNTKPHEEEISLKVTIKFTLTERKCRHVNEESSPCNQNKQSHQCNLIAVNFISWLQSRAWKHLQRQHIHTSRAATQLPPFCDHYAYTGWQTKSTAGNPF